MRKILCILLYDQECMVKNNNDNNCDEQSSSPPFSLSSTTLQESGEASCIISDYNSPNNVINIDWFNTLLNYSLIIINSIMVLSLMRVINNENDNFGTQEQQQQIADGCSEIPSHLSIRLCFAFGKRLCFHVMCVHVYLAWHAIIPHSHICISFFQLYKWHCGNTLYTLKQK